MVEALATALVAAGMAIENAFGAFLISHATAIAYTTIVAGSIAVGRAQQRRAEAKMREAQNRSLQDRSIVITSGAAASACIYGRAKIGGVLVHAEVTGSLGQFLHLVIAHVKHECDAIEAIYFGDTILPAENPTTGFVESGKFVKINQKTKTVGKTSNGSGVVTFDDVVKLIISVVTADRTPAHVSYTSTLTMITLGSNTLTGLAPNTSYIFTYTYDEVIPLVRIRKHLGQPGQVADADLIAESAEGWSASDVGVGTCYTYIRIQYDHDVFASVGIPDISARIRGFKVFDPRTSTTYWTDNGQLCTSHYVLNQSFGLRSEASELIYADQIAYANNCDEEVPVYNEDTCNVTNGSKEVEINNLFWFKTVRPGMIFIGPNSVRHTVEDVRIGGLGMRMYLETNYTGTTASNQAYSVVQKRFTCNGVLGSDEPVWPNFEAILDAMGGSAVYVQGRWIIRPAVHQAPVLTINESFLSGENLNIVPHKGHREVFNGVRGQYFDRYQLYTETSYPPITSPTYETQDKNERIMATIDYSMVDNPVQCQRLSKVELNRARQSLLLELTTNLRGYDLIPGSTVLMNLAEYGFINKLFIVLTREYSFGPLVKYVLQETASALYDWTFNEALEVNVAPNSTLPSGQERPTTLTGLTANSGDSHLNITPSGQVIVRALVSWNQSPDVFVRFGGKIEVEWKQSVSATWLIAGPVSGDDTSVYINDLLATTPIDIRVRAVSGVGKVGDWTYHVHQVVGKGTAPSNVTNLSAVKIPGAIRVLFDAGSDRDHSGTELRRFSSNVWASGVRLDNGVAGSTFLGGRISQYDWAWPADGTYVIMARHRDTTGNLSAGTTAITISVTAGEIAVYNFGLIGGANLIQNSSFEVDTNADGIADTWNQTFGGSIGSATLTWQSSGGAPHGSRVQRVRAGALTGGGTGNYLGIFQRQMIQPGLTGTKYVLSASLLRTVGLAPIKLHARCLDGAFTYISGSDFTLDTNPTSSDFQRFSLIGTIVTGARFIEVLIYEFDPATTSICEFWVDAVQLELGEVITAYSPRADEILAGAVGTIELADESATTLVVTSPGSGTTSVNNGTTTQVIRTATWVNARQDQKPTKVQWEVKSSGDVSWNVSYPSIAEAYYEWSTTSSGAGAAVFINKYLDSSGGGNDTVYHGSALDQLTLAYGDTLTVNIVNRITHTAAAQINYLNAMIRIAAVKK